MQKKAVELVFESEKAGGSVEGSNLESKNDKKLALEMKGDGGGPLESKVESSSEVGSRENLILEMEVDGVTGQNGSNAGGLGSRGMRIRDKLEKEPIPVVLEVEDISYLHNGHAGVRGSDGETHFNVKVVSKEFEGKSLLKRHRLIYDLLREGLT